MVQTLGKKSRLLVKEAEDKMPIENSTIYVAPPDYHLLMEHNLTFALDDSEPVKFCKPAIDVTLQSGALTFGENTVAIILSGANSDGADGAKYIENKNGLVLVQNPEEAEVNTMPLAAIKACQNSTIVSKELLLKIATMLPTDATLN